MLNEEFNRPQNRSNDSTNTLIDLKIKLSAAISAEVALIAARQTTLLPIETVTVHMTDRVIRVPTPKPLKKLVRRFSEIVAEVGYLAGTQHWYRLDSRDDIDTLVQWAHEFHDAFEYAYPEGESDTYIEDLTKFVEFKLSVAGGRHTCIDRSLVAVLTGVSAGADGPVATMEGPAADF